MTAAHLDAMLQGVRLTVIESARLPPIGVGEATTPMINAFLAQLGFTSLESWMPACNATFKTGILFENWYDGTDSYWHPFELLDYVDGKTHAGHCWLHRYTDETGKYRDPSRFARSYLCSATVNAQQNRIPFHPQVAYNFDATLFGKLLRSGLPRVNHVVDEVVDVEVDEAGDISALVLASGERMQADFYVDCTGFRRQLIKKAAPEQTLHKYTDSLFNDRAVVFHLPYRNESLEQQMFPYVKATALSAGWVWSIPLFNRMSTGYVYSSRFLGDDEAEAELTSYWGDQAKTRTAVMKIQFETGKLPRIWARNCVAIGLSGGFIEPLESSGLAITQTQIELLASMLDARYYDDFVIERYNAYLEKLYTDIIEFMTTHYCLTSREDTPYWKAVKYETRVSPQLQARFETFREYLPTLGTRGLREAVWAFRDAGWFLVMLGMRFDFRRPEVSERALAAAAKIAKDKRRIIREMTAKLPNHHQYLATQVYGNSPNPAARIEPPRPILYPGAG